MCTIDDKSRRVLKPRKGLRFFSLRNHNVESYGKGRDIQKGIYNIDGFQIRFYTEKQIQDFASARSFGIL
jgi:hypothetical protein